MRRSIFAAWFAVLPVVLAGCGQSGPTTAQAPTNNAQEATEDTQTAEEAAVIPANLNPQETVVHYLQAVKEGDERQVAALLTEVARRKTAEANIAVAPPGSETATFSVGDMEIVGDDKKTAHVASMWTDADEAGEQTLRIVWVLRQEPEGWRITGMITRLTPKSPMLVLDFEDPEETVRRTKEEIARRQAAEAETSQQAATDQQGPDAQQQGQQPPRQARNPLDDQPIQPR